MCSAAAAPAKKGFGKVRPVLCTDPCNLDAWRSSRAPKSVCAMHTMRACLAAQLLVAASLHAHAPSLHA